MLEPRAVSVSHRANPPPPLPRYLDQLERSLETIGLLPAETSLGGVAAFDLRESRGRHAPKAAANFAGAYHTAPYGGAAYPGAARAAHGFAPLAEAAYGAGAGIRARWVLPLQAGATSLGWDAAKRHLFVGTSSGGAPAPAPRRAAATDPAPRERRARAPPPPAARFRAPPAPPPSCAALARSGQDLRGVAWLGRRQLQVRHRGAHRARHRPAL